ncbi:unnamed protein product, partial [Rotaria socialis]
EQFIDNNNKFSTTRMESLTTAKIISELEMPSKFISSDEDRPLTDFAFFEPNSIKAKEIHPNLICGFNGVYKLQRSTARQNNNIHDRSLTVLILTTGDRWPQLLEHFYDAHQTNVNSNKSVLESPLPSMKVTLSGAKAAVHIFDKLLLPQSIKLFNTDTNVPKNNTINELKIIEHHVNCFSISDLTHSGVFHSN